MIDGNRLVEVLSLPSHDKRVLKLLKDLGLKKPVKDKNYDGVAIILEDPSGKEKFEIDFDEDCKSEKQKRGAYGNIDFYLNALTVEKADAIIPPFGIAWSDSYEEVEEILGRPEDRENKFGHKIWVLDDSEKTYILNLKFDKSQILKRFTLLTYNLDKK